jgi:GT2 family glycosyltransferase
VITPCYNFDAFVEKTISSIDAQTFKDWVHLLVNDGSTDRTGEILDRAASLDSRRYARHQQNQGQNRAKNRGAAVLGDAVEYLFFLDADDTVSPDALEKAVAYLDANPKVGMVYWQFEIIDEEGKLIPDHFKNKWGQRHVPTTLGTAILPDHVAETPLESVLTHCGMIPSCILIRRSVFEGTDGFNDTPQFRKGLGDVDLFIQMTLAAPVHRIPLTLTQYRAHSDQITADIKQFDLQYRRLLERWRTLAREVPPSTRNRIERALLFAECRKPLEIRLHAAASMWKAGSYITAIRIWLAAFARHLWSLLPSRFAAPTYLKLRRALTV